MQLFYRPNIIIRNGMMFENMIRDVPYNEFIRALLRDDIKEMNHYMNDISIATFSFFDVGTSQGVALAGYAAMVLHFRERKY